MVKRRWVHQKILVLQVIACHYPVSVCRTNWSAKENEILQKVSNNSFKKHSFVKPLNGPGRSDDIDTILQSVSNLDITPEMIRQFLPKVNWEQLDIKNRSAAENVKPGKWMSSEDPLINHGPWTATEDDYIRLVTQNKSVTDWLDVAVSLGTNRTPFQCLARFQRSLNTDIMRREWTPEEDDQLRAAVGLFGEKDWQSVANEIEGRTGTQCSNRWKKSLVPSRKRVGKSNAKEAKWSSEEDKHPRLNFGSWSVEEITKYNEAVKEHGEHGDSNWSKVASQVHSRTSKQCSKRWETLNPHLKLLKKEAMRQKKADAECESETVCADTETQPKRRRKGLEKCSGDVCRQANGTEDNGKEKKQVRKRKSVAGTSSSDNSTVTTNCSQVKVGIEKLKPKRKVSAVVPIENHDVPN
ncbi:hypothetical protein Bca52824_091509 [Brassica carinata]|uniref:Uncharacterized protein n=1 Tax=Brassica carinata TaxID=52824 RepID=A0A8X7TF17_BRACI|nr:hypothetical protein Bca52824_091509 [Brassica carinata]